MQVFFLPAADFTKSPGFPAKKICRSPLKLGVSRKIFGKGKSCGLGTGATCCFAVRKRRQERSAAPTLPSFSTMASTTGCTSSLESVFS